MINGYDEENHDNDFIHWNRNYTYHTDTTYVSGTFVIFAAAILAFSALKVASHYIQRHQSQLRERASRVSRNRETRQRKVKCKTTIISELDDELLNECSICLEKFGIGQEITELPCYHSFHKICLNPWIQDNRNCPLCRLSV